jgi:hypothetical protein
LLGPMLYRHVFHRESGVPMKDIGPQTAEAFYRAFARGQS